MNRLYFGDNLAVMRKHVADKSVDLVYLDPPFNSNANYNLIHRSPVGDKADAQRRAFKDTWRWEEDAASIAMDEVRERDLDIFRILQALQVSLGTSDLMAYLVMMSVRLIELRRVLKATGSMYLHCDPTASHYLKIILDAVFGADSFRSEIVWKRSSAHNSAKRWGPVHDTLLFYTVSKKYTWNPIYQALPESTAEAWYNNVEEETGRRYNRADLTAPGIRKGHSGVIWRGIDPTSKGRHWAIPGYLGLSELDASSALDELDRTNRLHWPKSGGTPMFKRYLDESKGIPAQDVISDIDPLNNSARERLGYPTQKPVALLDRIIRASSNLGDVVLDPFCGCGTTVHASEMLERRWVGIDVSYDAILVIQDRLKTWLPAAEYKVDGIPTAEREARILAKLEPYTFQEWAVGRLGGRSKGRGADRGIDGEIVFLTGNRQYGRAIVSVKAGQNVNPAMVRELAGTVQREGADLGIFVCVNDPTREMKIEAQRSEIIALPWGQRHRIQIVTAKDLIDGPNVGIPTAMNSIVAAEHAKALVRKRPAKAPTPQELRQQPPLPPMSLSGGKAKDREQIQATSELFPPTKSTEHKARRRS